MSHFRRVLNWGWRSVNRLHYHYPIIIGTTSTGTLSTFYCFGASGIEPVDGDGDGDDDKQKKRIKKRRKKKAESSDDIDSTIKPSQVDRINGHYQNRIRQMSTPEKIFSTFASTVNKKGQQMMTFNDFCEAILPYDFRNESAAANMKNKQDFKKKKKDENIPELLYKLIHKKPGKFSMSLPEFIFLTSLLSIPPADFEFVFKIFDLDGNGKMDANEFKFLLEHFKVKNTSNYDITADNIMKKTNIWKYLFGLNEERELTLSQFQDFLFNLRECILRIEYIRYCGNINYKMSPKNFAMSLISYAHHSEVSYYVARVNRLPTKIFNRDKCSISYKEFLDFNKCLFSINDIMRALNYYAKGKENITQQAFHHTVKCITNINLNKHLVNIMFWVLDKDGDNTLDQNEIQTLLTERFQYGQATDRIFLAGILKCFGQCFSH